MGKARDFLNARATSDIQTKVGIAGFTLLARVRNTYAFTSEVPTTYLEDGSSVEDHIILNPVPITIEGRVADVFVQQSFTEAVSSVAASTAGAIGVFAPERTSTMLQKVGSLAASANDALAKIDSLIGAGVQVASFLGVISTEGKTLREKFVDTMESLHFGLQVVDIEMPYRTFKNMRINVTFDTDNVDDALNFKIEAVQVRTAEQALSSAGSLLPDPSPALNGQAQTEADKGVQEGASVDTSLLGTILGFGG